MSASLGDGLEMRPRQSETSFSKNFGARHHFTSQASCIIPLPELRIVSGTKIISLIALCFLLCACNNNDLQEIEVVVVSKTPRGAYAEGNNPDDFYGVGWYNIGLSRNGEKPIEYIWRAGKDPDSFVIMNAVIGDKGTICLHEWAIQNKIKLPRPNAENPPIIAALGEVYWKRINPVSDSEGRAR